MAKEGLQSGVSAAHGKSFDLILLTHDNRSQHLLRPWRKAVESRLDSDLTRNGVVVVFTENTGRTANTNRLLRTSLAQKTPTEAVMDVTFADIQAEVERKEGVKIPDSFREDDELLRTEVHDGFMGAIVKQFDTWRKLYKDRVRWVEEWQDDTVVADATRLDEQGYLIDPPDETASRGSNWWSW